MVRLTALSAPKMKFSDPEVAPREAAEMVIEYVQESPPALKSVLAQPLPGVWPTTQAVPWMAPHEIHLLPAGAGAHDPFCCATVSDVAVTEPTTPGPATCQLATPVLILVVAAFAPVVTVPSSTKPVGSPHAGQFGIALLNTVATIVKLPSPLRLLALNCTELVQLL